MQHELLIMFSAFNVENKDRRIRAVEEDKDDGVVVEKEEEEEEYKE